MKITYLADQPQFKEVVADWLFNEWGDLHQERPEEQWLTNLEKRMNHQEIPLLLLPMKVMSHWGLLQFIRRIWIDKMSF